ncbi:MAG: phosphatidylserine decarboxylase [Acidobacteriota bacterium]|nr:phosphatidylserine decarboxylase [Acidobacteriota bacterium]
MVRDGIYYALAFTAVGALVSYAAGPWFALPLFVVGAFCAYFFRDPERLAPAGDVAVSPADGKVVAIVEEPGKRTRISIFLNIFDVHVNRMPISGVIADVQYSAGKFLIASREHASVQNEQNTVTVRGDGTTVVFKQIAGLLARRIVFTRKPGEFVQAGERVGLIKFGSRVDVIFGPEWILEVRPGMRVAAGSSVLARRADRAQVIQVKSAPLEVEEGLLCQT